VVSRYTFVVEGIYNKNFSGFIAWNKKKKTYYPGRVTHWAEITDINLPLFDIVAITEKAPIQIIYS
jgi:hypothetical protein